MNLIFVLRIFCLLTLITFVIKIIFGSTPIHWNDWFSGVVCAIAVYYLEPLFGKYLRGKKFSRR
ncbi:MAG: hypothetical protein IJL14_04530 [Selenomonadaceae bacterium]|nr:hypothetical protein [Selenomonadaceae bacterium]